MAYDEGVAERVRDALADRTETVEKKMFGGLCFMIRGHMCVGVNKNDLMVRVGPDACDMALELPGARPMDFTGRPLKGFVFVGPEGLSSDEELERWVDLGLDFVQSLPPK